MNHYDAPRFRFSLIKTGEKFNLGDTVSFGTKQKYTLSAITISKNGHRVFTFYSECRECGAAFDFTCGSVIGSVARCCAKHAKKREPLAKQFPTPAQESHEERAAAPENKWEEALRHPIFTPELRALEGREMFAALMDLWQNDHIDEKTMHRWNGLITQAHQAAEEAAAQLDSLI